MDFVQIELARITAVVFAVAWSMVTTILLKWKIHAAMIINAMLCVHHSFDLLLEHKALHPNDYDDIN